MADDYTVEFACCVHVVAVGYLESKRIGLA
jgi:hypothetical protein